VLSYNEKSIPQRQTSKQQQKLYNLLVWTRLTR
jgi:hypothetical protein